MELKGEGWSGIFYGSTPVEGFGEVDGRPFYFRARWETWWLAIAEPRQDPLLIYAEEISGWIHDEDWPGGKFAAGYMSMEEVRLCMERGIALFRSRQQNDSSKPGEPHSQS
ncbi:hypothetical protein HRD49_29080 [Corallococcus exiguus]|uniref:hypothetical protein n=1 Tax=Corallococcus exiguus TaxID=83462 RepID=UPI001560632F|nr:hypothetical protein [Corallococcus exiguus]NRD65812.1 hypothetical protein [Corallococcus exiguus]